MEQKAKENHSRLGGTVRTIATEQRKLSIMRIAPQSDRSLDRQAYQSLGKDHTVVAVA